MSQYNKEVGKFIDKQKSDNYTKNWKKTGIKTESVFIGSDIIQKQLLKTGAVGLRIKFGMDDEGNVQPVFYAANAKGAIIRTVSGKDEEDDGGANASLPCPPICPE